MQRHFNQAREKIAQLERELASAQQSVDATKAECQAKIQQLEAANLELTERLATHQDTNESLVKKIRAAEDTLKRTEQSMRKNAETSRETREKSVLIIAFVFYSFILILNSRMSHYATDCEKEKREKMRLEIELSTVQEELSQRISAHQTAVDDLWMKYKDLDV